MRHIQKTIFLLILILGFSCSVKKQATEMKSIYVIPEKYKAYTTEQRGNTLILTFKNETTPKMPIKFLNLVLIDTETNEVFFEDQLREGNITFLDDNLIKVSYTPGNPQIGKDYSYYFDIKTKKKVTNYKTLNSK